MGPKKAESTRKRDTEVTAALVGMGRGQRCEGVVKRHFP